LPFPIDIEPTVKRGTTLEVQSPIEHHDAAAPLLYCQQAILDILNTECCQPHIDMNNAKKITPLFNPGGIIVVQKQVPVDTSQGISVKLRFKTKVPYLILEQVTPNSYNVQKFPFLRGLDISGRICKESAIQFIKLPFTLIIHRRLHGSDTGYFQLPGPFTQMPQPNNSKKILTSFINQFMTPLELHPSQQLLQMLLYCPTSAHHKP
jgi:hypothetical protein